MRRQSAQSKTTSDHDNSPISGSELDVAGIEPSGIVDIKASPMGLEAPKMLKSRFSPNSEMRSWVSSLNLRRSLDAVRSHSMVVHTSRDLDQLSYSQQQIARDSASMRDKLNLLYRQNLFPFPVGKGLKTVGSKNAVLWKPTTIPAAEMPRKIVFGEADYLRDKLGFCMPPTSQILATEVTRAEPKNHSAKGFQHSSGERIRMIHNLFAERAAAARQNDEQKMFRFNPRKSKVYRSSKTDDQTKKGLKKGMTECEQYVVLLDAYTRRAKHLDEKVKNSISREIFQTESKRVAIDSRTDGDEELVKKARSRQHAANMQIKKNIAAREEARKKKGRRSYGSETEDKLYKLYLMQ